MALTALRSLGRAAPAVLAIGAVIAIWQLVTRDASSLYVKSPGEIADALVHQVRQGVLGDHVWPSASRLMRGWGLAVVVGISAGLTLGRTPRLLPWIAPVLHTARSVPPPAMIGILFVSFGPGDGPKVFLVFCGSVFPILFNAVDGAASVDQLQLDAAAVLGVRPVDRWTRIVVPSAAPKLFAGLRASSAIALILVVTSEVTGSVNGLGRMMSDAQQTFKWVDVWVVLVVLATLGLILNTTITLAERQLLSWRATEGGDRRG